MIISISSEKAWQTATPIRDKKKKKKQKPLTKLRIKDIFFNLIKNIFLKNTANIHLKDEKLEALPLRLGKN